MAMIALPEWFADPVREPVTVVATERHACTLEEVPHVARRFNQIKRYHENGVTFRAFNAVESESKVLLMDQPSLRLQAVLIYGSFLNAYDTDLALAVADSIGHRSLVWVVEDTNALGAVMMLRSEY